MFGVNGDKKCHSVFEGTVHSSAKFPVKSGFHFSIQEKRNHIVSPGINKQDRKMALIC